MNSTAVDLDAKELFGLDQIARLIKPDRDEASGDLSSRLANKISEEPPAIQARILVKAGEDPDTAPQFLGTRLLTKVGGGEDPPG